MTREQERALIDAAIAEGRVTVCPPGWACGTTKIEALHGSAFPTRDQRRAAYVASTERGARAGLRSQGVR